MGADRHGSLHERRGRRALPRSSSAARHDAGSFHRRRLPPTGRRESRLDGCATSWPTAASSSPRRAGGRAGTRSTWAVANLKDADYRQRLEREARGRSRPARAARRAGAREVPSAWSQPPALRRGPRTGRHHPARPGAGRRQLAAAMAWREARAGDVLEAARRSGSHLGGGGGRRPVAGWPPGVPGGSASWSASTATMTRPDSSTGCRRGRRRPRGARARRQGPAEDACTSSSTTPNPLEGMRESLTTLGNGYLGTRGPLLRHRRRGLVPAPTCRAVQPVTRCSRREVEEEGLVNVTNWLPVNFRVTAGVDGRARHHRERPPQPHRPASGVLRRFFDVTDAYGNITSSPSGGWCRWHTAPVRHRARARAAQLGGHGRAAQRPRRLGDHQRDGRRAAPSHPHSSPRRAAWTCRILLDRHEHEPVQGPRGHGRSHRGQPLPRSAAVHRVTIR